MKGSLGENIRAARKALKLSQEELAELIGSNRVTISKYENNEYNPSVPALKRLADALHTTPAELTGDMEEEEQKAKDWFWESQDETIRLFARGVSNMTQENREKLLAFCRIMFHEDFDEEGHKKK